MSGGPADYSWRGVPAPDGHIYNARVTDGIERLRASLKSSLPTQLSVSESQRQYFFDDDEAAVSELDVQDHHAETEFLMVATEKALYSDLRLGFFVRVWSRHAHEVWVLDTDSHAVSRICANGKTRIYRPGEEISSPLLPDFAVAVDWLFR